jgi:hypothetical protein
MRRSALLLATLAAVSALATAQVPPELSGVLARLQPDERRRIEGQAAQWAAWPRAERRAFAARARDWDALPLAERRRRREAWAAWSALPAAERIRLRAEAARVAALPPAEQAALRAKFDALDASAARGWMLGPALGADYPRLQPLLAQVPPTQRADLLRTLRAMTPLQRVDLAVLVQRTPPTDRERLRRELVSTSEANRAAWLQLSLER